MSSRLIDQYKKVHENKPNYGRGGCYTYFKDIVKLIGEDTTKHIVDFGCGKGSLVKQLQKAGYKAVGYDPAIDEYADERLLEAPCDVLVSTDVFEHIPYSELTETILGLKESLQPSKCYFVISCRLAQEVLPNGENAHCTVMDKNEWANTFRLLWPDKTWCIENFDERTKTLKLIGV